MSVREDRNGAELAAGESGWTARPASRMKIAFVVHDYHRAGGHSRYVAELATRFSKEHEVHVFANRIQDDGTPGIQFHHVPTWRANAFTTVLTFALPATLQVDSSFDIVHSQGFCGFLGNVFTAHVCNQAWYASLGKLEGRATLRESIFNVVASGLEHGLYRFRKNCEVIAVSERVKRDLVEYYHCPSPIQVIYHGTDTELFSPQVRQHWRQEARALFGVPENEFAFLYVGHLRKGARRSIDALARLERGVLLCVSSTDAEPYRQFARERGVEQRVIFAGHTKNVEKVYAAGDAFLLPTPYDSFAMVASEAMGCGLPVVVSREAGVSELIEHRVNGLVLEDVTSRDELVGHMRALLDDPQWAETLGCAGRKTVEKLTWDGVASQTMRVYQELIQKRRGSQR
jgi:UDP-glucose:(heptosyl)LPS alpha-1,3-glucosyltransferase